MTWQDVKDYWWAIGILLTFIASVWNLLVSYRAAREARYGNLVTAERLKWINELRTHMSQFCGRVQTWMAFCASNPTPDPQETAVRKELNRLRYHIRLLLDSRYATDQDLEALIAKVSQCVDTRSLAGLQAALEEITQKTQVHLNNEWRKVKTEADKGKLR